MNTVLQETALTQTYQDVENLINKIVWSFHKNYGGDIQDWKSEAHLFFMRAYYSYDESMGSFITWLHIYIENGLKNYLTMFISKNQPSTVNEEGVDSIYTLPDNTNPFYTAIDLLDEVKEDAKVIIKLIWDMPEDLQAMKIQPGNSPKHIKCIIKNYLLKLGWTHRRVKSSFTEIGEALYA